jgi:hypothetical protein
LVDQNLVRTPADLYRLGLTALANLERMGDKSADNLIQAINEMSDYLVQIRLKEGVWGQLITITRKSTTQSYIYSDVESWWHSNTCNIIY